MHRPYAPLLLLAVTLCLGLPRDACGQGGRPIYSTAPGTPLCSAGDPVICAWSSDGLVPAPTKYAVEILVAYDPDCASGNDFSAEFSFTTSSSTPMFEFRASALDKTICASHDSPCSEPSTYHAASLQMRVKALHPPSRHRAQNNPFSAWSATIPVPGVCAAACPQSCAAGMDSLLTRMSALKSQAGLDSNLTCSYDSYQQAGVVSYGGITPTGVLPIAQGSALIGVGYCLANFNGADIVNQGLHADEQAACATRFAPAFGALAGQSCDIGPH